MSDKLFHSDRGYLESRYPLSRLDSGRSSTATNCPLCDKNKQAFYCEQCIAFGNFTHSRTFPERYADKKNKWVQRRKEKQALVSQVAEKLNLSRSPRLSKLKLQKAAMKERLSCVSEANELARISLEKEERYLAAMREETAMSDELIIRLKRRYGEAKVRKEEFLQRCRDRKKRLGDMETLLARERRMAVSELLDYVFLLSPERSVEDSMLLTSMSHSFRPRGTSGGNWVSLGVDYAATVTVLYARLPANGDYNPMACYVTAPGAGESESEERSPGDEVLAGLALTSQLVHQLAFWLDLPVPARLAFRSFCVSHLSERALSRAVARLNHTVLQMCCAVGFARDVTNPRATLRNLFSLLNSPNLGRTIGPVESPSWEDLEGLYRSYLAERRSSSDSDSDDTDLCCSDYKKPEDLGDWESVPASDLVPHDESSLAQSSASVALSSIGGLVNSLFRN